MAARGAGASCAFARTATIVANHKQTLEITHTVGLESRARLISFTEASDGCRCACSAIQLPPWGGRELGREQSGVETLDHPPTAGN